MQLSFAASSSIDSFIKDGRLKPLAVTTARRDPLYPELPTITEAGVPGFVADIWYGFVVPVKTPKDVVKKLADDLARAMGDADTQSKLRQRGLEPAWLGADAMGELMRRDVARWKEVATKINLTLD